MTLAAGKLRTRLIVRNPITLDGGRATAYARVTDLWGTVTEKSFREVYADAQRSGKSKVEIRTRYSDRVTLHSRLYDEDAIYRVISITDPDKRRRELLLVCEELSNLYTEKYRIDRQKGEYSPTAGTDSDDGTERHDVWGASPTEYGIEQIDNEIVKVGDIRVVLNASGLSIEPQPDTDTLVIGGVAWSIVRVRQIRSEDEVVSYEVQARGG